jgi:hypothetical protein
VTLSIVFAVLFSALLHATWNSLAHAVSDRLVGFALIGVADGIGGGLMVVFAGMPPAGAWPFIIASAASQHRDRRRRCDARATVRLHRVDVLLQAPPIAALAVIRRGRPTTGGGA